MTEDIRTIAARLLGALDDPNAPHLVMVTDPKLVPGFCDFYGPYPSAMAAANAIDDVRATIDPRGPLDVHGASPRSAPDPVARSAPLRRHRGQGAADLVPVPVQEETSAVGELNAHLSDGVDDVDVGELVAVESAGAIPIRLIVVADVSRPLPRVRSHSRRRVPSAGECVLA
ncbi:hypothetical protein [Cnuibacter physcomitrellae]|nr:hypothetical protein [Cnuibacter physcomitrellae]